MSYLAKNNAYAVLAAGISAGATSLTVASGKGDLFPVLVDPDYTFLTLEDAAGNREIVKATARAAASDVITITRAQEGTVARAWNLGDVVELRMTAELVQAAMAHALLTAGAHTAAAIANVPSGTIAATSVQAAINELAADKEPAFATLPFSKGGTNATTRAAAVAALGLEAAEIAVTTAANATTDIGAVASSNILLTTTVATITGFAAAAAGVRRNVRVSTGGITLEYNAATFILPGNASIVAAAGDCFEAESLGSGAWVVTNYQRRDGQSINGGFAAGTAMLFVQAAAPTGWTKSTAHNDKTLRVVSGSGGGSGGVQAFSTVFGRTAVDASSLSIAQLAAHTHTYTTADGGGASSGGGVSGSWTSKSATTGSQGSGAAHSHGLDLRVQYVDVIICEKN